ncbi:hypothetical protein TWF481_003536 [Arthrobotrys musiformis]|uniref:C2H2-type domain-containing protein n=1 Tax=Arthrobotrys musiformis TaxID=47236 RepID=A0AAV9WGW4_9PEZI
MSTSSSEPETEPKSIVTERHSNDLLERFNLAEYTYRNTIVCTTCRVICFPNHVPGHLKKNHLFQHAELKRSGLLIHVKGHRWASEKRILQLVSFLTRNRPTPLEPFQTFSGWQCPHCRKCYRTKQSLNAHISQGCTDRPDDTRIPPPKDPVQCQKILGHKHGTLVRIYPSSNKPSTTKIGTGELDFLRGRRAPTSYLPSSDPTSKSDPWLLRTGWLAFCAGDSQFVANTLCPLTAARGRSPKLEAIAAATRSVLNKSLRYIGETSDYYRRKLETPGPHRYAKDLFGCQKGETKRWYIDNFVRMVLYICSLSKQEKLIITKTEVSLEEFGKTISRIFTLVEREHPSEELPSDGLEKEILALIVQCLTTKIPANSSSKFQHPVINFLAVEGYDEKKRKWRDARHTFRGSKSCNKVSSTG